LGFWNPPAFSEEAVMPSRYPVEVRRQVVELARSGTRVAQLAETFGMSEAVIYGWLKQERIDCGEAPGLRGCPDRRGTSTAISWVDG
jgi:transposase-like protein